MKSLLHSKLISALEETGQPWHAKEGKRNVKIFVNSRLATCVGRRQHEADRAMKNAVASVNGARNLPTFGLPKFPTLAGWVISPGGVRHLRFWVGDRAAEAAEPAVG